MAACGLGCVQARFAVQCEAAVAGSRRDIDLSSTAVPCHAAIVSTAAFGGKARRDDDTTTRRGAFGAFTKRHKGHQGHKGNRGIWGILSWRHCRPSAGSKDSE